MFRGLAVVLLVALVAGGWWWRQRPPEPAPTNTPAAPGAISAERTVPAGCDPLPVPPPLPTALTPSEATIESVVQALDASLSDAHKRFLRCFPDEDDLVARVHSGFGRWLRNSLRLHSDTPLTASLRAAGLTNADQMSSVIMRAYGQSLQGQLFDMATTIARTKARVESPEQP